jgi:glutaredoxin
VAATVDLYVTSWCGYCKKAREFLRARGVPFTEYDIEQDADAARRKQEIDPRPGVPLAVINGQVILGFSASTYERALVNR